MGNSKAAAGGECASEHPRAARPGRPSLSEYSAAGVRRGIFRGRAVGAMGWGFHTVVGLIRGLHLFNGSFHSTANGTPLPGVRATPLVHLPAFLTGFSVLVAFREKTAEGGCAPHETLPVPDFRCAGCISEPRP